MKVNENAMIENINIENNNVANNIFFGLSFKQLFIIPLDKIPPTKHNNKSMCKDKSISEYFKSILDIVKHPFHFVKARYVFIFKFVKRQSHIYH